MRVEYIISFILGGWLISTSALAEENHLAKANRVIACAFNDDPNKKADPNEFKVFNEPEVLEALVKFQGYRMIGIGHTKDNALADIIADYSAPTPTNLGGEIKEKYIDYLKMLAKIKNQNDEIKRLTKEIEENERLKAAEPIRAPVREETQKTKDDKLKQRIMTFILLSALAVLIHIAYKSIF